MKSKYLHDVNINVPLWTLDYLGRTPALVLAFCIWSEGTFNKRIEIAKALSLTEKTVYNSIAALRAKKLVKDDKETHKIIVDFEKYEELQESYKKVQN